MEKLIEFNDRVEQFLKVDVLYNSSVINYKVNNAWVTDISHIHFQAFQETFKELIDTYINKDHEKEVIFLKNIKEELRGSLDILHNFDFKKKESFISHFELSYPKNSPTFIPKDMEEIIPLEYEGRSDLIFHILLDYLGIDVEQVKEEVIPESFSEINDLLAAQDMDEFAIDEIYARAHLWIILNYQSRLIIEVIQYIESYLVTLSKMGVDYLSNPILASNTTNPYELQFNLTKEEVAIFFENLYKNEFIETPGNSNYKRKAHLKNFIDNANFFYLNGLKRTSINEINKEFTKLKIDNRNINLIDEKEGELLSSIIMKFSKAFSSYDKKEEIKLLEKLTEHFNKRINNLR